MSKTEYGGYLPIEINKYKGEYYVNNNEYNVLKLNCGRSAFYYACLAGKIKKIYLPIFTCIDTEIPFKINNVKIEKYLINEEFLPKGINLKNDEFLLWTNYYGNASDKQINLITKNYKNLIIDNCHAFFSAPLKGAYNCYSARKFFGVSDGAYLVKDNLKLKYEIERDKSYKNFNHLLKQLDMDTNEGYKDNLLNEERLNQNYKSMSFITERILQSINYKKIQKIRNKNFHQMHNILGEYNEFPINTSSQTHMYYPFLNKDQDLRYKLIENKIYNPFWWEHVLKIVPKDSIEYKLSLYTVMLPIDQRYNKKDIEDICKKVKQNLNII